MKQTNNDNINAKSGKSDISDAQKMQKFKKRNFYTIKDSGLVYLFALLLPLGTSLIFSLISVQVATSVGLKFPEGSNILQELFSKYVWFAAAYLLLAQVTFLLIWLVFHPARGISFSATKFSVKKANVWLALLSMFVGIVCVLGFVWLMEGCFGKLFTIWNIDTGIEFKINTVGRLFMALFVLGIVPAICEELIFRGVVFGGLRKSFGMWTSVLLCAVLFALMHKSPVQLLYPFVLGCVLSVVMEKTGNILYPILIHMFNNFTTIIMTFVFEHFGIQDLTTVFNVKWWGILCAIALAGITCIVLWLLYRFVLCKNKKHGKEVLGADNEVQKNNLEENVANEVSNENSLKENSKARTDAKLPPQENSAAYENSAFMIGKIPLTLLCGIILGCIFLVISFF